ncbi:MAG: GAF domain-containing protein [Aquincola tertiaricarbonis]
MTYHPPFGQADLSNCERELIHLAGSVQPHGALLVLRPSDLQVLQASANTAAVLGLPVERLLERPLQVLGGDLAAQVAALAPRVARPQDEPVPLQCTSAADGMPRVLEGSLHRVPDGQLVVEVEAVELPDSARHMATIGQEAVLACVSATVQRLSAAASLGALADAAVQGIHELTGYDRVMVYQFDPDGHGKIIAEARDPRLESLLGHHYPATDIPQRARALYLRNRVRVLMDVHYQPAPLVPARLPPTGQELDMSMCYLRSMSPLHLQYLKNMGVTATLVVSLVHEGRLWGLIAAHHYQPRNLRYAVRTACDLLAEVIATRIAAIENYAHAQVALVVRRLEQRLIEATSTEGDWRLALLRNPATLLQPLGATGAALFHDGEVLTSGEVPSTPELRALARWVDSRPAAAAPQATIDAPPLACSSIAQAEPALASLTPVAAGVLAVRLSASQPDYLMWFRKEQLLTVTWAGDPHKPKVGDDPMELSPRRSFAAWSEIVRGTALPWTATEIALARAFGSALVDIIVQVHAVRLLIAERQLVQIRGTVQNSREPVAIADAHGRLLHANEAFRRLLAPDGRTLHTLDDVAAGFRPPQALHDMLRGLKAAHRPWRGELALQGTAGGPPRPVGVRAEIVPARDGSALGLILTLTDLVDSQRAAEARRQLEASLQRTAAEGAAQPVGADEVMRAILSNASLVAMDIADGPVGPDMAPLLQEVEASTQRAATLYGRIRLFGVAGDAG